MPVFLPPGQEKGLYTGKSLCYNTSIIFRNDIRGPEESGCHMPGEKEINVNLFERLDLIERLEIIAESNDMEAVKKQLAMERRFVERKLYQQPPLTGGQQ